MDDNQKLPSALDDFAQVQQRLAGNQIAVFLDYDGTLTPIADRPELAVLSGEARLLLDKLGGLCPTALVSGRALPQLKNLVGVDNLFYAGSHGFDIVGPQGSGIEHRVGTEFAPAIEDSHAQLCAQLDGVEGVIVEAKRSSLAVHYRLVQEGLVSTIEQILDRVLADYPTLYKAHGKKVFEVRPRLDWNKGRAVEWIFSRLGLNATNAMPVYIGDDVTDEDAFRAIAGIGIGILVAKDLRPTAAIYGLEDAEEVALFLGQIVALQPRVGGHQP